MNPSTNIRFTTLPTTSSAKMIKLDPNIIHIDVKRELLDDYKKYLNEVYPDQVKIITFDKNGKLLIIPSNAQDSIKNIMSKSFPDYKKTNLNDSIHKKHHCTINNLTYSDKALFNKCLSMFEG